VKTQWTLCFMALLFLVPPTIASQTQSTSSGGNESDREASGERKKVETQLHEKLNDLDREIKDLKDKAAKQGKSTSKEIHQQLDDLDQKRTVARRKLKELERSSQGAWQETKKGFDAVMDDLEETYKRAASHF
jgi:TolA-binding protein